MVSLNNNNQVKNSLTKKWHLERKGAPSCTSLHGSFTVEAAVTIPIFAGFMVCILFFFCIMQVRLKVEQALNHTGREIAAYACLETSHSGVMNPTTELAMTKVLFLKRLQGESELMKYVQGKGAGISLLTSDFSGDYIELKANYQIKLPIGLFGIYYFPMQQHVKVRKWTGYEPETEDGEWVYITPTGTVYHITKACPYLDLSIHAEDASKVTALRNKTGRKYKPCSKCSGAGTICYITDYGTVYHKNIDCSGLKRTVYRIKKTEAGDKKPCSKCGGAA